MHKVRFSATIIKIKKLDHHTNMTFMATVFKIKTVDYYT